MTGVKRNGKTKLPLHYPEFSGELPSSFDARQKWPDCITIGQIRDQGSCGSCWAFGAVSAMSDRICIASGDRKLQVTLSAEDLNSCSGGYGCNGGDPSDAWQYYIDSGIVSGALYGSHEGCKPYTIPACEHHVDGNLPPCTDILPTPACTQQCEPSYNKSYTDDKHFGLTAYKLPKDEQAIMKEIYTNGPVEADFEVYEDFFHYKSGVYRLHSKINKGGHAVKMLGWGVENGTPYWLCANSWNPDW